MAMPRRECDVSTNKTIIKFSFLKLKLKLRVYQWLSLRVKRSVGCVATEVSAESRNLLLEPTHLLLHAASIRVTAACRAWPLLEPYSEIPPDPPSPTLLRPRCGSRCVNSLLSSFCCCPMHMTRMNSGATASGITATTTMIATSHILVSLPSLNARRQITAVVLRLITNTWKTARKSLHLRDTLIAGCTFERVSRKISVSFWSVLSIVTLMRLVTVSAPFSERILNLSTFNAPGTTGPSSQWSAHITPSDIFYCRVIVVAAVDRSTVM